MSRSEKIGVLKTPDSWKHKKSERKGARKKNRNLLATLPRVASVEAVPTLALLDEGSWGADLSFAVEYRERQTRYRRDYRGKVPK